MKPMEVEKEPQKLIEDNQKTCKPPSEKIPKKIVNIDWNSLIIS